MSLALLQDYQKATYYGISKFFKDKDMNLTVAESLEIYKDNNLIAVIEFKVSSTS